MAEQRYPSGTVTLQLDRLRTHGVTGAFVGADGRAYRHGVVVGVKTLRRRKRRRGCSV